MSEITFYDQLSPLGQDIAEAVAVLPPEGGKFTRADHYQGQTRIEEVARIMIKGCRQDAYALPGCFECMFFASGRTICEDTEQIRAKIESELNDQQDYRELPGETEV